jgi:hypothetical protein
MDGNAPRNRILSATSDADRVLRQPHLEPVPLKLPLGLQSSKRSIRRVYFPDPGVASVVAIIDKSPCDVFLQVQGNSLCIDPAKRQEAKIKASLCGDYGLVEMEMAHSGVIRDRDRLEECANGFDSVPEAEYQRLFGCAGTGDACVTSSTS